MIVREAVEFIIFPKFFNVLSFYSKGNYSLKIKLCAQDADGNIIHGYPTLHEGKQANKTDFKKAWTSVLNTIGQYTTEQFYVTYNEESILLNTLCQFKIEYDVRKQYKTYIDIELKLTKFKIINKNQQKQKNVSHLNQRIHVVDKKRIHINRTSQINTYKRLIFDQSQYFSYVDLYIGSVSYGLLFRSHQYQMCQFMNFTVQQRREYYLNTLNKQVPKNQQIGKYLKDLKYYKINNNLLTELQNFYKCAIIRVIKQYQRLVCVYNSIRAKMIMLNNNSQVIQKIKTPALNSLKIVKYSNILSYYHYDLETDQLYFDIYQQSQQYLQNVKYIWNHLVELMIKMNLTVFESLLLHQELTTTNIIKQFAILRNTKITQQIRDQEKDKYLKKRSEILKNLKVYEEEDQHHPFLMIENSKINEIKTEKSVLSPNKQTHDIDSLTIFVHGYKGSDADLERAKNFMSIYASNSHGLLIKSLQQQDEADIKQLGKTLSQEILIHINNSTNNYSRINFIGYSMGGILVRQTLKYLVEFKDKMNLFISLAAPHLGIKYSQNALISTGVWYLINIDKVKTMKQLNCQLLSYQSVMKRLSVCQGLSWFKKVIFVSCKEDHFVPYYSSRLDQTGCQEDYMFKMCQNLKKNIRAFQRVQVWFDTQHDTGTWDKLIGRRAHIEFLENKGFLDSLFRIYGSQL